MVSWRRSPPDWAFSPRSVRGQSAASPQPSPRPVRGWSFPRKTSHGRAYIVLFLVLQYNNILIIAISVPPFALLPLEKPYRRLAAD